MEKENRKGKVEGKMKEKGNRRERENDEGWRMKVCHNNAFNNNAVTIML
jgi:hypothetical protein